MTITNPTILAGRNRFFKYRIARETFSSAGQLTENQCMALDQFFLDYPKFIPWHITMLISMMQSGFINLSERYTQVLQVTPRSLSYFTLLWGEEEGKIRHGAICNQARKNLITTDDYWEARGLRRDEEKIQLHNTRAGISNGARTKGRTDVSGRSVQYWLNKGYSQSEAETEVRRIQTTNGKNYYIAKYGKEGLVLFEERKTSWLQNIKATMVEKNLWRSMAIYGDLRQIVQLLNNITVMFLE